VSAWPELRDSRTVTAGHAPGTVIHCGLMDVVMAELPVSVVFCYERAVDIDRLAEGLSRALGHIPVFAGRIRPVEGGLEIVCDDSGISMTTYDFDDTLAEVIGRFGMASSDFVDHVQAPAACKGELPLCTVRVTRLSDGGMVVGCSWHHAVGDMHSFMLLMRAWSAFVEGMPPPAAELITDPDTYLDAALPAADCGQPGLRLPDEDEAAALMREITSALRANRVVQAFFTDAEIARMKAEITLAAGRRLSTNDVLCGHVLSTLRALDEDFEARSMAMPVNVRGRLDLPDSAVGNLVNEIYLTCAPKSTAEAIAIDVRAGVNSFLDDHLSIRANRAFLESIGPDRLRECFPLGFNPMRKTFAVTNWSRFGVYDIVFDGQAPALFSPVTNLALPWVGWFVEGFGGTGVLFVAALPARLANRVRGADGRAALHVYRDVDEELPPLAQAVRKLA
jgi:hypothetical protein